MGPTSEMQVGPTQEWQHKSLACCVAQESLGKEEEKDVEVVAKKTHRLWQKKNWKKLT